MLQEFSLLDRELLVLMEQFRIREPRIKSHPEFLISCCLECIFLLRNKPSVAEPIEYRCKSLISLLSIKNTVELVQSAPYFFRPRVTEHTINQKILCRHQGSGTLRYISHFSNTAQPKCKPAHLPFLHTGRIKLRKDFSRFRIWQIGSTLKCNRISILNLQILRPAKMK